MSAELMNRTFKAIEEVFAKAETKPVKSEPSLMDIERDIVDARPTFNQAMELGDALIAALKARYSEQDMQDVALAYRRFRKVLDDADEIEAQG